MERAVCTRSALPSALRHQYCQFSGRASMLVLFIDHKPTQVCQVCMFNPPRQSTVSLLFLVANVTSAGLLAQIVSFLPVQGRSRVHFVLSAPLQTPEGRWEPDVGSRQSQIFGRVCVWACVFTAGFT